MNDIVIFKLGKQNYGLPVNSISKIIQMVAVTELPDLPAGVLGMINYQGDVIPLLDLRQIYGTPVQPIRLTTLVLIAKTHAGNIGLLVDGVEGVISDLRAENHQATSHRFVKTIIKNDDMAILMVNSVALAEIVEPLVATTL